MSTVYKIDGAFANRKYRGAGHAVAAIYHDRIVDMVYLRDVFRNMDEYSGADVLAALASNRLAPAVRLLSTYGDVYIGMCSRCEFTVF